ncbi:MAG: glycosyltransferase [Limnohabitans sp.]|nr:glycosyltransferase [Limnohabitans sp.]
MILVTVGSQLPFDRLIAPVAAWGRARGVKDIFFQHGGTTVNLTGFNHAAFIPPDEFGRLLDRATVVITHVGMGTILGCLERGKPILVLPRKASLGETRNEHQSASARSLEGRPGFVVAWNDRELPVLLDRLDSMQGGERISSDASPELLTAVRAFVHGTRLPRG